MGASLKEGRRPRRSKTTELSGAVTPQRAPLACPAPPSPVRVDVTPSMPRGPKRCGAWIDGRERVGDGPAFPAINPWTGKVVAEVAESGADEVAAAVFTARRALESGDWPAMSAEQRAHYLFRFAALLELRAGELAKLEARDTGRPVSQMLRFELPRTVAVIRQTAQQGVSTTRQNSPDRWSTRRARPRGVLAVVVSWQSPLLDLASAWSSAWTAGCTVVTKPAPEASLLALRLAQVAAEAGLPDGVLNVLPGPAECGAALVEHGGTDAVVFTGRANTAVQVRAAAALSGKPVIADVGGLCPALVLDDADAEAAAQRIMAASFAFAGQLRRSVSRVFVTAGIAERLLLRLGELADALRPGDPADTATALGPMIDPGRAEHARWITQRCLGHGGRRIGPPTDEQEPGASSGQASPCSSAVAPVVVDSADRTCPAVCRPTVGPLLTVTVHDSPAELVAATHALLCGEHHCPAVGVFTRDLPAAQRLADRLDADHIGFNTIDPYEVPLEASPLYRLQRVTTASPS